MTEWERQRRALDVLTNGKVQTVAGYYRGALMEITDEIKKLYASAGNLETMTPGQLGRLAKLSRMYERIHDKVDTTMRRSSDYLRKAMPEYYSEAFQRRMYAATKEFKADLGSGIPDDRLIKTAIHSDWSKLENAKALSKDRTQAYTRLKNQISLGLEKGESADEVARRVAQTLGFRDANGAVTPTGQGELYKAARIARTEMGRVSAQANEDSFQEMQAMGLEVEKVWLAVLDGRTREDHGAMDGEAADEDGYFTLPDGIRTLEPQLTGDPGHDINCRCISQVRLKGDVPESRYIGGKVEKWTTFEKWKVDQQQTYNDQPISEKNNESDQKDISTWSPCEAKTLEESERWAIEKDIADYASYKDADVETANEWNNSISQNIASFPQLRGNLKFIGTTQERQRRYVDLALEEKRKTLEYQNLVKIKGKKWTEQKVKELLRKQVGITPSKVMAYSVGDKYTSGIQVNVNYGKNAKAFRESLKRQVAAGFHPVGCDTIKSVADHEIGHQLDTLLKISSNPRFVDLVKDLDIEKELSVYALHSPREIVAEAWAEYLNNQSPRKIAKAIGEFIEKEYLARYGR